MPTVADLGQRLKAKYPGIYDDLSDDEVGRRIKTKYPESYGDFSDPTPRPGTGLPPPVVATAQNNPIFSGMKNPDLRVLDALPTVGGFVGGAGGAALGTLAGGVGAIPGEIGGAALGGSAGEGLRQYLKGERVNPGRVLREGAFQGAGQALGIGAAKGIGAVAGKLIDRAAAARGIEAIAEQPASKMLDKFGNPIRPAIPGRPAVPGKPIEIGFRASHIAPGMPGARHIPIAIPIHPAAVERLGATLARPNFLRFMRQSPKGAAQYIQSLFYAAPSDATQP